MSLRAFLVPLLAGSMFASASVPNDPGWNQAPQWGLKKIGLPAAWLASRGSGVVVAVVDTGVDLHHPDLRGRLVPGVDVADGGEPNDVNGHGTLVAGIIAADTNNGIGVASVAPLSKIMPVRVLGKDGTGSSETVAEGIRYASDHGADVINLSLAQEPVHGFAFTPSVLRDPSVDGAIRDAVAAGAVVVVAAGNDSEGGKPQAAYDSGSPGVLVVGASTNRDRRAAYSNYGRGLDLIAPGGGSATDPSDASCADPNFVVSTWWDPAHKRSSYGGACGTSMAVGFVSGVAALLRARGMTNTQIVSRILHTAKDLGPSGRDAQTGWGRIDAARALGVPVSSARAATGTTARASVTPTPTPSPEAPTWTPSAQSLGDTPSVLPPDLPRSGAIPIAFAAGLIAATVSAHAMRLARRKER